MCRPLPPADTRGTRIGAVGSLEHTARQIIEVVQRMAHRQGTGARGTGEDTESNPLVGGAFARDIQRTICSDDPRPKKRDPRPQRVRLEQPGMPLTAPSFCRYVLTSEHCACEEEGPGSEGQETRNDGPRNFDTIHHSSSGYDSDVCQDTT